MGVLRINYDSSDEVMAMGLCETLVIVFDTAPMLDASLEPYPTWRELDISFDAFVL